MKVDVAQVLNPAKQRSSHMSSTSHEYAQNSLSRGPADGAAIGSPQLPHSFSLRRSANVHTPQGTRATPERGAIRQT